MSRVAIIGAGQAGAALAEALRDGGHTGPVTLIGAEPHPPYQRPPLSKAYLLGEMARERLFLRPEEFYSDRDIDLRLGAPVEQIDPAGSVRVGGDEIGWDHLVFCTGATPRRLPDTVGGALPGVYVVRGLADIDALAPEMRAGRRLLVVGGGYIGLEAAAVARKIGLDVTLIEAADRILQRVACAETSQYFDDLHGSQGVEILSGARLERLTGDDRVTGADLSDGAHIAADLVIVGIGVTPDVALAEEIGVACDGGILVDTMGATNLPGVWAAGDCARLPYRGTLLRLESVQNAIDQAQAVAANILGAAKPYEPKPWFWSDQYDVKLQIAGLNLGYDRVVARPGARDGTVSHWYFAGDTLLSVDALNDPRAYMIGKRLIEAGKSPAIEVIEDPESDLKALL